MNNQNPENVMSKPGYSNPQLKVYGPMAQLTAGGTYTGLPESIKDTNTGACVTYLPNGYGPGCRP